IISVLVLAGINMPSNAQTSSLGDFTIVAAYSQGEKSKPVAYLQEGLTELTKLLDVGIIYEPSLVRNIQIDKSVLTNNEGVSVETLLPILLNNTNFIFKEVSDSGIHFTLTQPPAPPLNVPGTTFPGLRFGAAGRRHTRTPMVRSLRIQPRMVQRRVLPTF